MARAVQIFKDNELRTRDLEKDVEASRGASEIERTRLADTERQRARDMAEATAGLAEGLKQLAGGNLVFSLDVSFAEDFEPLRANFNAAVVQLAESLRAVSHTTRSINDGAQEIALSAQDLSRRTEHQAASLEETAASLDQITQISPALARARRKPDTLRSRRTNPPVIPGKLFPALSQQCSGSNILPRRYRLLSA